MSGRWYTLVEEPAVGMVAVLYSTTAKDGPETSTAVATLEVRSYTLGDLLDRHWPPQPIDIREDDGAVRVGHPVGWSPLPLVNSEVVRFCAGCRTPVLNEEFWPEDVLHYCGAMCSPRRFAP